MNSLTQPQVRILKALRSGSARFQTPCKLSQSMTVMKQIVAETKSDALVLLGNITLNFQGQKTESVAVAVKVTFMPKRKGAASGSILELKIYKAVVQGLILNNNTPNVVMLYAAYTCDYSKQLMPPALRTLKSTLLQRKDVDTSTLDLQRAQVLVMELVGGVNVEQFLRTGPSQRAVEGVLFQVLFTLVCFQRVGLRHNDLHFGNIMVDASKLPRPTFVNYFVTADEFYRIDVAEGFIKIFDFERASLPQKLRNPDSHTLNTPNYKYDLFSFLSRFLYVPSTPERLKKQLRQCCMSKQFAREYDTVFALCRLNKAKRCVGKEAKPSDKQLNTPLQFLKKLFSETAARRSLKQTRIEIRQKYPNSPAEARSALAVFFKNSYYLPN